MSVPESARSSHTRTRRGKKQVFPESPGLRPVMMENEEALPERKGRTQSSSSSPSSWTGDTSLSVSVRTFGLFVYSNVTIPFSGRILDTYQPGVSTLRSAGGTRKHPFSHRTWPFFLPSHPGAPPRVRCVSVETARRWPEGNDFQHISGWRQENWHRAGTGQSILGVDLVPESLAKGRSGKMW